MNLTQSFAGGAISASVESHIGKLVFSNPARKNALNLYMWLALPNAIAWLCCEAEARVIVIAGEGSDFSAGADISEFATVRRDTSSALAYENANANAFSAIRSSPAPTVALIRGICFGGGFGMAAACDFRLADKSARFAIPAAKLGLAYPVDAMQDIVGALGAATARLALFTGRQFSAQELAASGGLTTLTDPEALEETVMSLAHDIAANAPLSIRASKTAILSVINNDKSLAELARQQGAETFESDDYREGRAAFADRRKPQFTGK